MELRSGCFQPLLAPRKIRVNAILPDLLETDGTRASCFTGSDFEQTIVAHTPLGRTGQPEDIADVAVFLASDDTRWVTGEKLLVSGGLR